MEWLTRLPVVGPLAARILRTRAYRVYEHLAERHWNRLAASITVSSFIALFPLLTAAAALSAAFLDDSQRLKVQQRLADQVPGLADQMDLDAFFHSAGTVGIIALGALLITGVNWIGAVRDALRAVWDLDRTHVDFVRAKALDALLLLGLGGILAASLAVSVGTGTAASGIVHGLGLGEAGVWLVTPVAYAAALAADFLVLGYALTRLPGVWPERRSVVVAALIGAVGFELLKLLLSGYLSGVASRSVYGAFGVPVALLLWLTFMSRLLLYCAGWTAAPHQLREGSAAVDDEGEQGEDGE